jgi:hypothetical protein
MPMPSTGCSQASLSGGTRPASAAWRDRANNDWAAEGDGREAISKPYGLFAAGKEIAAAKRSPIS